VVRYFWQVVLVSALSESLDRISVPAARKVLVDGFLANRHAWEVRIPTVPLETLYGGQLMQWLTQHGTDVRVLSSVEAIDVADQRATGVRLKSGEEIAAKEIIVAVPFQRVLSLLPRELAQQSELAGVNQLEASPISSVHLWFDRPIMDLPHAVFVEGLCQWVFNRTELAQASRWRQPPESSRPSLGEDSGRLRSRLVEESSRPSLGEDSGRLRSRLVEEWYYQVVISASRDVVARDSEAVLKTVLNELAAVWPAVNASKLLHSRQVTEHRAVFSPLPGSEELRPVQQSPIANLQLAGDWTRTGWPATMEGAVRSGYLAAENVLRRLGQPANIVQPDLPRARMFRWFLSP